jgi:O-antigen ligase
VSPAPSLAGARPRAALFALALLPVLAFVALRLLGLLKFAQLGAVAAAALAGGTLLFLRPRWGLYFLILYIYSGAGLFLPVNLAVPAIAIVTAAVVLSWLRGENPSLPDAFFWWAAGIFAMIALHSMLVARDVGASLRELMTFGKILLVIVLIVHLIRTPDQLRSLYYAVFAGAVGTIVLGIVGIWLGVEGAGEQGVRIMRFTGAHENPNKAAAYMCSALPLGLFAVKHSVGRLPKIAFTVGVVVIVVAIFATFSRSAVIPLTVVFVGVIAHELRTRRSFGLLAFLLALGILLAPRYYWDRVMSLPDALRNSTQDWSVYTRLLALQTAWEMFLDHPMTGVGLGNFLGSSAYRLFVRIVVHNTYLEILVGTGILGLAAYLAVLGSGFRHAVAGARRRWKAHPAWMRSLSYYTMLSAVSIGLSAGFGTMPFRYPLWVPVAAGLVIGNLLRADRQAHA